jgi:hypothetical protein
MNAAKPTKVRKPTKIQLHANTEFHRALLQLNPAIKKAMRYLASAPHGEATTDAAIMEALSIPPCPCADRDCLARALAAFITERAMWYTLLENSPSQPFAIRP